MKNLQIYKILKEKISFENVNSISELIVLRAIRTHCGYNKEYDQLYKGLLRDIFNRQTEEDTFSDAYDLVQDVNIFLLSHVGRQVDEVLYFEKKAFLSPFARLVTRLLTNMLGAFLEILKIACL